MTDLFEQSHQRLQVTYFPRLCFNLFKLANNLKSDNDQHIVKV